MTRGVNRKAQTPLGIARHPLYPALLPIPILCFVGALVTDAVYASAPDMMWLDFSTWLLLAGLIGGGVAGVVLIADMVRVVRARTGALSIHFVLLLAAWTIEIFNSFIHARDGWTAVLPTGITLSAIAVLLSLMAGWFWQSARHALTGGAR